MLLNTSWAGVPQLTTFQTRITLSTGQPLEASSVNFRFTILDTVGTCVIYIEDYANVNMGSSQGIATFSLGSGVKSFPPSSVTLFEVFNNATPSYPCQAGGVYTPSSIDRRQIVMQFNDGTGWQTVPQMAINSVIYANYASRAENLGGFAVSDFLRPSTLPTCSASEALNYNGSIFSCVPASGGGGGGVTSVTGTLPIVVTGATSSPVVSLAQATGAVSGYLSSADWTLFNGKASSTLNSGQLYLGSGDNTARGVTLSGDATLNNTGLMTLSNSGVAAGTYGSANAVPSLTVDAKGRVVSASSGAYQDATNVGKGIVQIGNNLTITSGVLSMTSADVTSALGYTPTSGNSGFANGGNAFSADSSLGATTNFGLNFKTNNLNRLTITGSGEVGIGTTTPNATLQVHSANPWHGIKVSGGTANSGVTALSIVNSSNKEFQLGVTGSTTSANIGSDKFFLFDANAGQARMVINSVGNVGIGTSNPLSRLSVQDAVNIGNVGLNQTFLSASDGDPGVPIFSIYRIGTNVIQFGGYNDSGFAFMSGNVGIGTTTPLARLHVAASAAENEIRIDNTDASGKSYVRTNAADSTVRTTFGTDVDGGFFWVETNNPFRLATNGLERLRVDAAGNVGIGTSTPTGAKLSVVGDINITGNYKINGVNISAGGGSVSNVSGSSPIAVSSGSTTPVVSIEQATATANGYLSSSDWTSFNNKASSTLANGQIFVGSAGNVATAVALAGDATIVNSGVITLASSGVGTGTYGSINAVPSFTIDAKGRVTSATANAYQDANNVNKGIVQIGNNLTITSGVLSMTSADVTNALGFTPANSAAAGFANGGNAFSADSSLGSTTNYALSFRTNNTNRLTIDNSGRVGIGTTTPGQALSVMGRIESRGGLLLNQGSASTDNLIYTGSSASGPVNASIGLFAAGAGSGGETDGPYFLARGNTFTAAATQRGNMYFSAGAPTAAGVAEGSLNFLTNATSRMTVTNNGKVGINVFPGYVFNVDTAGDKVMLEDRSTSGIAVPLVVANNATSTNGNGAQIVLGAQSSTTTSKEVAAMTGIVRNQTNASFAGDLVFSTSTAGALSEKMRILSSGYVGIGTTTPLGSLQVSKGTNVIGDAPANYAMYVSNYSSGNEPGVFFKAGFFNTATPIAQFSSYGGANSTVDRMTVLANGNVGIGTTSPSSNLEVVGDINITGNYKVNGVNLSAGGGGSVTSVTSADANISVANGTTTPVLTLNAGIGANKIPQVGGVALPLNSLLMSNGTTLTGKTCSINQMLQWNATDWVCVAMTSSQWVTNSSDISYAAGNVGIGTTSPAAKLDVLGGDVRVQGASNGSGKILLFDDANTDYGNFLLSDSTYSFFGPGGGVANIFSDSAQFNSLFTSKDAEIHGVTVGRGASGDVSNTAVGNSSLAVNTSGVSNTAVGFHTLQYNTSGTAVTAIGTLALQSNTTGGSNTAVGVGSQYNTTTGGQNTAVGATALFTNATGSSNTAIGNSALFQTSSGSNNIAIGSYAGYSITGSGNVVIGTSMDSSLAGLSSQISIGDGLGFERIRVISNGNVGIGTSTPNEKLEVIGNIKASGRFIAGVSADTDATVSFATSNTIRTSVAGSCGTLSVSGTTAGGVFTVTMPAVTATCVLPATIDGLTVKSPSGYASGATVTGVVYTMINDGTNVWVSHVPF